MITVIAESMRRWLVEMVVLYLVVVSIGFLVLMVVAWFGRNYAKYRGLKVVLCPETGTPATVEIDALHAALGAMVGDPDLHLLNCSRWKERGPCDEACVKQLTLAPPSPQTCGT